MDSRNIWLIQIVQFIKKLCNLNLPTILYNSTTLYIVQFKEKDHFNSKLNKTFAHMYRLTSYLKFGSSTNFIGFVTPFPLRWILTVNYKTSEYGTSEIIYNSFFFHLILNLYHIFILLKCWYRYERFIVMLLISIFVYACQVLY